LKEGKERMRCQVFLGFMFVGFHRSVENGYKVRMRGGCGGDSGHDGSRRDVMGASIGSRLSAVHSHVTPTLPVSQVVYAEQFDGSLTDLT
jgi:hypothetical protein